MVPVVARWELVVVVVVFYLQHLIAITCWKQEHIVSKLVKEEIVFKPLVLLTQKR